MQYIDQHVHTISSPDAYPNASIQNYIKQAQSIGQKGLMFTDHVDIDSPVPMFFSYPNYQAYFEQVNTIKRTTNLPIYTGVEVGYQPSIIDKLNNFIDQYPFDLVICSIHVADNLDFYYGDFFLGKTTDESIRRYFEVVLDAVTNFSNYDVFGHLNYITRYIKDLDVYDFSQYKDIITKILQAIIKNNKGIEINTSKGKHQFFPSIEVLSLYRKLGGELLTLGSDAHTPSKLQQNFTYALKEAKRAGFTNVYTFEQRRAIAHKIDDLLKNKNT